MKNTQKNQMPSGDKPGLSKSQKDQLESLLKDTKSILKRLDEQDAQLNNVSRDFHEYRAYIDGKISDIENNMRALSRGRTLTSSRLFARAKLRNNSVSRPDLGWEREGDYLRDF